MKNLMKFLAGFCAFAVMAGSMAMGYTVGPLSADESIANGGATHLVTISHSDFTETATNTAETLAIFPVPAKSAVEVTHVVLAIPFEDTADAAHNSTALEVGDGTDADLYVSSMELNENGTQVYIKLPREPITGTSTTRTNVTGITLQTATITNTEAGVTNVRVIVTNVVAATAAQASLTSVAESVGQKLYTSADTVDFKFTPNLADALASLNTGEVKIFIKMLKAP